MSQIVLGKVAFVDKGVYATASTKQEPPLDRYGLVEMYRPWYAGNGSGQDRPCGGE